MKAGRILLGAKLGFCLTWLQSVLQPLLRHSFLALLCLLFDAHAPSAAFVTLFWGHFTFELTLLGQHDLVALLLRKVHLPWRGGLWRRSGLKPHVSENLQGA